MKVSRSFTLALTIFLSFIPHLVLAADEIDKKNVVFIKGELIETNFLNLEAKSFSSPYPGKQIVIAARGKNLYLAKRESEFVTKFNFTNNEFTYLEDIQIPKMIDSNLFILDIEPYKETFLVTVVEYFTDPQKCSKMNLYEYKNRNNMLLRFSSKPCLGGVGAWSEIAGRIAADEAKQIAYITGGNVLTDLYRNRYPRPGLCCVSDSYKVAIKSTNLFGSVIQLNLSKNFSSKISFGHRGPQGIEFDTKRKILYESEHGPRGGDEINLIKHGNDYGWPYATLGRAYFDEFTFDDPGFGSPIVTNSHAGFTPPLYSWVPSIAPSQILMLKDNSIFYKDWQNSLLVSTLKDMSIRRLKLSQDGTKILYDERIPINHRIRDLEPLEEGIVLSTDDGMLIYLTKSKTPIAGGTFPLN